MPGYARKTHAQRAAALDIQLVESKRPEAQVLHWGANPAPPLELWIFRDASYGQRNESARNMQRHFA
jgi:hypothetical protein